jgi:hypothetical protein
VPFGVVRRADERARFHVQETQRLALAAQRGELTRADVSLDR